MCMQPCNILLCSPAWQDNDTKGKFCLKSCIFRKCISPESHNNQYQGQSQVFNYKSFSLIIQPSSHCGIDKPEQGVFLVHMLVFKCTSRPSDTNCKSTWEKWSNNNAQHIGETFKYSSSKKNRRKDTFQFYSSLYF